MNHHEAELILDCVRSEPSKLEAAAERYRKASEALAAASRNLVEATYAKQNADSELTRARGALLRAAAPEDGE